MREGWGRQENRGVWWVCTEGSSVLTRGIHGDWEKEVMEGGCADLLCPNLTFMKYFLPKILNLKKMTRQKAKKPKGPDHKHQFSLSGDVTCLGPEGKNETSGSL